MELCCTATSSFVCSVMKGILVALLYTVGAAINEDSTFSSPLITTFKLKLYFTTKFSNYLGTQTAQHFSLSAFYCLNHWLLETTFQSHLFLNELSTQLDLLYLNKKEAILLTIAVLQFPLPVSCKISFFPYFWTRYKNTRSRTFLRLKTFKVYTCLLFLRKVLPSSVRQSSENNGNAWAAAVRGEG